MTTIPQEFQGKKVDELREELVSLGHDKTAAEQIKGKANVVAAILSARESAVADGVDLVGVEEEEEEVVETDEAQATPEYNSVEWEAYVLSLLVEGEYVESSNGKTKHPKVAGLRRLAGELLGPIVFSSPVNWDGPKEQDEVGRATVQYLVKINWEHSGEVREFGGLADSCINNTDDSVAGYPAAVADTRAEVRALKRALRVSTVAWDEFTTDKDPTVFAKKSGEKSVNMDDDTSPEFINSAQISAIEVKCKQLGLDVEKYINSGKNTYESIEKVPYEVAQRMFKRLNQYQSNTSTTKLIEVPEELKFDK